MNVFKNSMSEQPMVSVLMTVYNREKYIAEAIESVLQSTFSDFELIIVDDHSKDNSLKISCEFEKKDSRIRVIRNKKNLGDYPNRNKAAIYATGKYIKYFDSDDIMYSHCLETLVSGMERFPEAGIGFTDYSYDGKKPLPRFLSPNESFSRHFLGGGLLFVGPSGSIYRRDFFEKLQGFRSSYKVAADYEFNLRAAQLKPVVIMPRDLFWYNLHPDQEFKTKQNEYLKLNYLINREYLYSDQCPLSPEDKKLAQVNFMTLNARKVIYCLWAIKPDRAIALQKLFKLNLRDYLISIFPSIIRNKLN